jgi:hypothetical protein
MAKKKKPAKAPKPQKAGTPAKPTAKVKKERGKNSHGER